MFDTYSGIRPPLPWGKREFSLGINYSTVVSVELCTPLAHTVTCSMLIVKTRVHRLAQVKLKQHFPFLLF